jgi:SAM-dependent methyltransferase
VNGEWWETENLLKSELDQRASLSADPKSDFGSYRMLLETSDFKKSLIKQHNELSPIHRTKLLRKLLGPKQIESVLDIGCGIGITTQALFETFENASVTGIDISQDAITYAKSEFRNCVFVCEAVDSESGMKTERYDLICAFEFYPFSRTLDYDTHLSYTLHLLSLLTPGGCLVIWQRWNNPNSYSVNYEALRFELSNHRFESYQIPLRIVSRFSPLSYKVNLAISKLVRLLMSFLRIQMVESTHCVIISEERND